MTVAGTWNMIYENRLIRLAGENAPVMWYTRKKRKRLSSPSQTIGQLGRRPGHLREALETSHYRGWSGQGLATDIAELTEPGIKISEHLHAKR